jgi:hypothetical protein
MPRSTQVPTVIARCHRVHNCSRSPLEHDHKFFPRPPKAIFDLGNTNPDRVGAHRGMGHNGSGSGSQGGEPTPIL